MNIAANSVLYLDGVTVSFDGFRALNSLSLVIEPGEMRAIIGPNGAGKTTMMDVITGKTRPDLGDVRFDGSVDLTRLDEAEIAELGIGRKFQKPTVFENQTVTQNLSLALSGTRGVLESLLWFATGSSDERLQDLLETTRLTGVRNEMASSLSHGQKQWLEIGMLLAQDPKV
ncbi:MAG: ATP-binding cassette domain-containing protein, partial [Rhizobiales bacterium]|nr:ATP-binding cassette domain-containing protein [Hyphomicrobiales bacterium]